MIWRKNGFAITNIVVVLEISFTVIFSREREGEGGGTR